MLIALSDRHEFIRAEEACTTGYFSCPGCKKKVILKKGQVKIPHFAHLKKEGCASFSEGETEEHLKGKLDLYNWLKSLKMPVQLEPYLSELQQRPDILTIIDGVQIAIEFQCSPISIETIKKRTEGYVSQGYKVVWIVGQKIKIKDSLTATQKAYIGEYKGNYYFLHYNFNLKKLFVYSEFKTNDKRTVYHKISVEMYELLPKKGVNPLQKSRKQLESFSNMQNKMKKLRLMSIQKQNQSREFFSLMYKNHDTLQSIPLILFESVEDEWMIQTFPYQWKYEFLIWVEQQSKKRVLTLKIIKRLMDDWQKNQKIVLYTMPNIPAASLYNPLFQFIDYLVYSQVLVRVGENKWKYLAKAERTKPLNV